MKGLIMKILYINNDGGGFADYIEVEEGTNIEELFEQRVREGDSGDYLIRVNRQPVSRDYVLKDNDRVTFTPTKIEGAIQ
jgi:molybdopterin converting factor small subunit